MNRKTIYIFLLLACFSLVLISCGSETKKKKEEKQVEIYEGAIIENIKGTYSNYNYDKSKYERMNLEEVIAAYEFKSANYIGQKGDKYIANYKGKTIELKNVGVYDSHFSIAPNGEYLSFFRMEDGNELVLLSLMNGEYIDLNIKVSISGKYLDWIDEETIIYYGVRGEDKKNGLFTYNLNTKEEKLFLEIEEGYVEFIKTLNDQLIFVKGSFEGSKSLIKVDLNGENTEVLSNDINKVYDIVNVKNSYYILGKFINGNFALYKLEDNINYRLTYEFPYYIDEKKGLMLTSDNNILFIGGSNSDKNTEEVYMCDESDTISLMSSGQGEISFIRRYTALGSSY